LQNNQEHPKHQKIAVNKVYQLDLLYWLYCKSLPGMYNISKGISLSSTRL